MEKSRKISLAMDSGTRLDCCNLAVEVIVAVLIIGGEETHDT